MALAWPPTGWIWALPLGWLGFTACMDTATNHPSYPLKQGAGVGFFVGVGLYAILIQWMTGLHPLTWTGLSALGSWGIVLTGWGVWTLLGGVAMGLVGTGWAYIVSSQWFQQQPVWAKPFVEASLVGGLWVLAPKLVAGVTDVFIPWASLVDVTLNELLRFLAGQWLLTHGGIVVTEWVLATLLTVLASTVLRTRGKQRWITILVWVVLGCAFGFFAKESPHDLSHGLSLLPTTTLVQANLPIEAIRATGSRQWMASPYESWLHKQHPKKNHLFILPEEGILHGVVDEANPTAQDGLRRLTQWATTNKATLAFGGTSFRQTHDSKQYYNSLMVIQPQQDFQIYQKRSLVPFGETIPQWVRGLSNQWQLELLQTLGFPYIPQLQAGNNASTVKLSPTLWAAPLICFEVVFPELLPNPKKHPYQAIIVVTNLGWMHHHPALAAQYLQKARVLAASQQRPVLIAANSGPSAIINSDGTVVCQLPPNTAGTLTFTPPGKHTKNPSFPLCQQHFHPIR